MYCKKCGTQLKDDVSFCHNCGAKIDDGVNFQNGTYYTPPNENYGNNYTGANKNENFKYDPNYTEKNRIVEKGDQAETLGIVGIIIGIVFWSVLGIILGAIGCRYADDAYRITGYPGYASAKSISKWAVIIGIIKIVIEILAMIGIFAFTFICDSIFAG